VLRPESLRVAVRVGERMLPFRDWLGVLIGLVVRGIFVFLYFDFWFLSVLSLSAYFLFLFRIVGIVRIVK